MKRFFSLLLFVALLLPLGLASTPPTTNNVAYWDLDKTLTDESGNGHTLTNQSATWETGVLNSAGGFTKTAGSNLTAADSADFDVGTGDFTVSFWIYLDNLPSTTSPISKRQGGSLGSNPGWGFQFYTFTGRLAWQVAGSTGQVSTADTGTNLSTDTWHHVVGIRDGGNAEYYLDGNLIHNTSGVSGSVDNNVPFYLGNLHDRDQNLNGRLDEVMFSTYAWDDSDVTDAYSAGSPENPYTDVAGVNITDSGANETSITNLESINLWATATSGSTITDAWLSTNETGTWHNYTSTGISEEGQISVSGGAEVVMSYEGVAYITSRTGGAAVYAQNMSTGALIDSYGSGNAFMGGLLAYEDILAGWSGNTIYLWNRTTTTEIASAATGGAGDNEGQNIHRDVADGLLIYSDTTRICKASDEDLSSATCDSSYTPSGPTLYDEETNLVVFAHGGQDTIILYNITSMSAVDSAALGCDITDVEQVVMGGSSFTENYVACKTSGEALKFTHDYSSFTLEWNTTVDASYNHANGMTYNSDAGIIVLGDRDEPVIHALNETNGNVVWTYDASSDLGTSAVPTCAYFWSGVVSVGEYLVTDSELDSACETANPGATTHYILLTNEGESLYSADMGTRMSSSAGPVVDGGHFVIPDLVNDKAESWFVGTGVYNDCNPSNCGSLANRDMPASTLSAPQINSTIHTSPQTFSSSSVNASFNWTNPAVTGTIAWRIYFDDDNGNTNQTSTATFTVSQDVLVIEPTDAYTGNSVNNFTVWARVQGSGDEYDVYNTTTGTINTNISTTSTDDYEIIVYGQDSGSYYNRTYNNYDPSAPLNPVLYQSSVVVEAINRVSGALISDYTVTTSSNGGSATGTGTNFTLNLTKAQDYTFSFNKSGYYDASSTGYDALAIDSYWGVEQDQKSVTNADNAFDEQELTAATIGASGYANYTFSTNITEVLVKDSSGTHTTSINSSCYQTSGVTVSYFVDITIPSFQYIRSLRCYDGSSYTTLETYSGIASEPLLYSVRSEKSTAETIEAYDHRANFTINVTSGTATEDNFTIDIYSDEHDFHEQLSTTTGNILANLTDGNYTVLINDTYHSFTNTSIELNSSQNLTQITLSTSTTNSITFRFLDEETNSVLNETTVEGYITGDEQSYNFTTSNGTYYIDLVQPQDYTITYNADGYSQRQYEFTLENRSANNLDLYLINSSNDDLIFITVQDSFLEKLSGAVVRAQRKNLSGTNYYTVETCTTDQSGECLQHLVLYDVTYRFLIEYGGDIVLTSSDQQITQTSITFTVSLQDDELETIDNIYDITGSLQFSDSTDEFSFSWNDPAGLSVTACLLVNQVQGGSSTELATTCTTSASGTLTQSVDLNKSYVYEAEGYVLVDGTRYTLDRLSRAGSTLSSGLGTNGLFIFAFLVIGIAAFTGLWNPVVGPVIMAGLVWLFNYLGVITIGTASVVSLAVGAVMVAYLSRG